MGPCVDRFAFHLRQSGIPWTSGRVSCCRPQVAARGRRERTDVDGQDSTRNARLVMADEIPWQRTTLPEPSGEIAPGRYWKSMSHAVVDLLRLVRRLRGEALAYSELLSLALQTIHDLNVELDRVRERYHALLDERRRSRGPRAA